jgi:hypothetical protein
MATITEDSLLVVLDGVLYEGYLTPIRTVGPGYELYQGQAAVFARVGLAVNRTETDAYIITASSPAVASGTVQFARPSAAAGAVTMKAGSIVRASQFGAAYVTTADAVFDVDDVGPVDAPVIALGYGYEYNVPGTYTAPNGDVDPGAIDVIDLPLQDPPFGDESILVNNAADITGGTPPALDLHGLERNLVRYPNETAMAFCQRIRTVTDTVSPAAIKRQLHRYLMPSGLGWRTVETWTAEYQVCYDAPDPQPGDDPTYLDTTFTFDDPRQGDYTSPIFGRWLGIQDYVGAFLVEVERPPAIAEYAFAYDDPAMTDGDQVTRLGRRAVSSYDLSISLPLPSTGGAFDAHDLGADDFFSALWDMLDRTKAYGVLATIWAVDSVG